MTKRLGIAAVVPAALHDAARELIALMDLDPAQRANIKVPVSASGNEPATHYLGNWQVASDSFFANLAAGSVEDPEAPRPDWIDSALVDAAYAAYQVYDPLELLQSVPTVFDPADLDLAKITLVILERGKRAETAERLGEMGLAFVVTEPA